MKRASALSVLLPFWVVSSAVAGDGGTIDFLFSSSGDSIGNNSVNVFAQDMHIPPYEDPSIIEILSLELDINGLRYDNFDDLDAYLIDPFGNLIEIMTDRGEGFSNTGQGDPAIDLTFADSSMMVVPEVGPIASGTYKPEGLAEGTDLGFDTFVGGSGGTDAWILLLIDDGGNPGGGEFSSWVLHGTGVLIPEPVTLSLLALGALTLLRRKRR